MASIKVINRSTKIVLSSDLEELNVTPSNEEQVFPEEGSDVKGYNKVTVAAKSE